MNAGTVPDFRRNLLKIRKIIKDTANRAVNLPKQHAGFNPVELLEEPEFIRVMLVFGELYWFPDCPIAKTMSLSAIKVGA